MALKGPKMDPRCPEDGCKRFPKVNWRYEFTILFRMYNIFLLIVNKNHELGMSRCVRACMGVHRCAARVCVIGVHGRAQMRTNAADSLPGDSEVSTGVHCSAHVV